jgi:putative DNA primase/helicase
MSGDLTETHVGLLEAAAIDLEVARAAGVRSVLNAADLPEDLAVHRQRRGITPGLLFPLHRPGGGVVHQYRPDTPVTNADGTKSKYLFPKGCGGALHLHPAMVERAGRCGRMLIVEGTKQGFAAVSSAPDDLVVVGIAGCWGWSSDGLPSPDFAHLELDGVDVAVCFDADIGSNPSVHDAGTRLADFLEAMGATVRWVRLPAGGKAGLDDLLASARPEARGRLLGGLIDKAKKRRPGRPTKKRGASSGEDGPARFFDGGQLLADVLRDELVARDQYALSVDGRRFRYTGGVYRPDDGAGLRVVASNLLGDLYRPGHLTTAEHKVEAWCHARGRILDTAPPADTLVNVSNGLLDLDTGELHPHRSSRLSSVQLAVEWDRFARCPTFDWWLEAQVHPDDRDDLLESLGCFLYQGTRQTKAVFLWGPTRSGKSTLVRLLVDIIGAANTSAVNLHDLERDRFAAADLVGSILNAAAELSAGHVEDVSTFKSLTGGDPVRAQRKYGQPFVFQPMAMHLFAMNNVPTVGEVGRAFLARIRPFCLPRSFEGREDEAVQVALRAEAPGIFRRLVEAHQRHRRRGGYMDTDRSRENLRRFARYADRVALFISETCDETPDGFTKRRDLYQAFEDWCRANHRQSVGSQRFYAQVTAAGYASVRRSGTDGFRGLELRPESDWRPAEDDDDWPPGEKGEVSFSPLDLRNALSGGGGKYVSGGGGGLGETSPFSPGPLTLDDTDTPTCPRCRTAPRGSFSAYCPPCTSVAALEGDDW